MMKTCCVLAMVLLLTAILRAEEVSAIRFPFPADGGIRWTFARSDGSRLKQDFAEVKPFSEGLAAARTDEKWGFIGPDGMWVIAPAFRDAKPFQEKRAAVRDQNGNWGFIDPAGKFVVTPRYRQASDFSDGMAAVVEGSQLAALGGYVDVGGSVVVKPQFHIVQPFHDGVALVRDRDGANPRYIDHAGKTVIEIDGANAETFSAGRAVVGRRGALRLIDTAGRTIADLPFERVERFSDGVAAFKKDGKWGFINLTGEIVLPAKYGDDDGGLLPQFRDGFAAVTDGGKIVLIDHAGRQAFPLADDEKPAALKTGWR